MCFGLEFEGYLRALNYEEQRTQKANPTPPPSPRRNLFHIKAPNTMGLIPALDRFEAVNLQG